VPHVARRVRRRDVNGLYAKAFAGEIKGFTWRRRPVRGALRARRSSSTPRASPRRSRPRRSSRSSRSSGSFRPR
jgi:hypothetical protein